MKYKIGLDIGAAKVLGIIWDGKKVFKSIKIKTPKNRREVLTSLFELIAALIDIVGKENVSGIGIAIAGVLDAKGKMLMSPNMKFINGLNLKELIALKFKKPVKIINDAKAFLLYELKLGIAKKYKNIAAVVLGSGVGGAFSINSKLVFGAHGSAGEIGHMVIAAPKTLEDLASVKNLKVGYKTMGEYLGIGLANIVNILDPEIIVIGGGLASAGNNILKPAKKAVKKIPVIIEKNYKTASAIGSVI